MRSSRSVAAVRWIPLVLALVGPSASAIELSILGPDSATVGIGEPFTIDVALDNASLTPVTGVVATLSGMDAAGAIFTGGMASNHNLVSFCFVSPSSSCVGGITQNSAQFFDDTDLSANGSYTPGDDSNTIISGLSFAPTSNSGANDPGLDGSTVEPSARDATLELVASVVGVHVLTVSGSYANSEIMSGSQPIATAPTFTLTVIPEPGTGLLVGLGLLGLARAGRESSVSLERTWRRPRV